MLRRPVSRAPLVTGAQYVAQITARESDRGARAAFRELVLTLARPGATLFDFGAGTGLDARFYAERGYRVRAYDIDPEMREYFTAHCRELLGAGRVQLEGGSYPDFLARGRCHGERAVDLVVANFAPLNLVADLRELFAAFAGLTCPDGRVLASVLSPYYFGDLRYRWWWRNLLPLLREGHFAVPGAQAPIIRRRPTDFAAHSAPHFVLERVFRGLPAARWRHTPGNAPGAGGSWLSLTTCRYMFLLFAKRQGR